MSLERADEPREVYILDTNEHTVSTAKSQFAEEYTRTSGSECLCICIHAP